MLLKETYLKGFSIENFSNRNRFFSLSNMKAQAQKVIFCMIFKLFPALSEPSYTMSTQMIAMHCFKVLETLFILSLLWRPGGDTSGSKNFESLWKFISYSRPDNICARFNFFTACAYISVSMTSLLLILLAVSILQTIKESTKKAGLDFLTTMLIKFLSTILYLPTLIMLLIISKYWINEKEIVSEYDEKSVSLPAALPILSIIGIIVLIFTSYLFNILVFESRHHFFDTSINSRSHSKIELLKFSFHTITAILYISILTTHQEIYRCLVGIESLSIAYSYYKLRPYYHSHTNTANITSCIAISSVCFCLVFGYLTNNHDNSFILIVFVVPFLLGIVYYITLKSLRNFSSSSEAPKSIYEFEIRLRPKLFKRKKNEKTIEKFSVIYNETPFGKNNTLILWLSNFCFYTLEDDSLARIKSGMEVREKGSWDIEYQIYQLKKVILSQTRVYREDIDYLNFRSKYEAIKGKDEMLCEGLLQFLHHIESGTDLKLLLKEFIPKLAALLSSVTTDYTDLVQQYPNSSSLITVYASFLETILNESQKSNEMLKIKHSIDFKNESQKFRSISYFDENNGLLIISGSSENFAIITYANEKVSGILGQSRHTIIGTSISSLVPYPFNINHDNHMKRFLLNCTNPEIKLPLSLFLQNDNGFLIECLIQIKCTALDGDPFFIVLLRKQSLHREIAVLKENGLILNHSKRFSFALGCESLSLKEEHIDNYLENLSFMSMQLNYIYFIKNADKTIAVVKSYRVIKNKRFNVLYLILDPNEIIAWQKGLYANESEYSIEQTLEVQNINVKETKSVVISGETNLVENEIVNKHEEAMEKKLPKPEPSQNNMHIYNPLKSLASTSTLNQNNFSVNPKFLQALGLIKKLKYILVLIVITVVTLQTASCFLIAQNYKIENIDEISNVAELAANLADIAVVVRGLQLGNKDYYSISDQNRLSSLLDELKIWKSNFRDVYKKTECDASSIFPKILEFDPSSQKTKKNEISNILNSIMLNIEKLLIKENELAFEYSIINSIIVYKQLHESYHLLKDCKEQSVLEQVSGSYLLCASCIFSVISVFIIACAWFMLKKIYGTIWNMFCNLATKNLAILTERVTSRLVDVHSSVDNKVAEASEYENKKKTSNYSSFLKYFNRIIIYVLVLTSFYLIILLSFIPSFTTITNIQPQALTSSYDARVYSLSLNFWEREKVLNTEFDNNYVDKNFFESIDEEIEESRQELKGCQEFFVKQEFLNLIEKSSTYQMIYSEDKILDGEYDMLNSIILYSYDIGQGTDQVILENYVNQMITFSDLMKNLLSSIKSDVNNYYLVKYQHLLIFTLIYLFGEIFMFIYMFLGLLHTEEKKIESIKKISEFIPIKP